MSKIIDPSNAGYLIPPDIEDVKAQYSMGWSEIAKQLQIVLASLPLVGKVHRYIKWVKDNPDTELWQNQFMYKRFDGRIVLNTILISESSSPESRVSAENSNAWTRRTSVELHVFLEIEDPISWFLWAALLKQIDTCLRNGDRTLNGNCLTYSLPSPVSADVVGSFCGVDCHAAQIRFQVEESGVS